MSSRLTAFTFAATLAAITLPAHAQTIKPGLWELNNKVQADNSQLGTMLAGLQAQMANMPADQRKAMEAMLQKNAGVTLPEMKDGGMVLKTCISKEMAAQGQLPIQQQGNCTHQRSPLRGSTMKMSFTCTNPASSGDGEINFTGDSAFSMKMKLNSSVNGRPESINVDGTGKWLGADCGTIKPIPMQPAAPKSN